MIFGRHQQASAELIREASTPVSDEVFEELAVERGRFDRIIETVEQLPVEVE